GWGVTFQGKAQFGGARDQIKAPEQCVGLDHGVKLATSRWDREFAWLIPTRETGFDQACLRIDRHDLISKARHRTGTARVNSLRHWIVSDIPGCQRNNPVRIGLVEYLDGGSSITPAGDMRSDLNSPSSLKNSVIRWENLKHDTCLSRWNYYCRRDTQDI